MKSFSLTIIALLGIMTHLYAQTSNTPYQYIPKYDPPKSPNVSSFERYTSIPGNFQTGQINPSIPLMSFEVDNLTIPLTLKYSNVGLKVSDVASWAGMGWNLEAGGMVTRTVKGLPDDGDFGMLQPYTANQQQLLVNNQMSGKARFTYFQKLLKQEVDTEHDIFNYNVLGISGSFYINKLGQCIQLPNSNNKIQYTTDQHHRLATFKITDDNGNDYFFTLKEESAIIQNANSFFGNVDYYYNALKGTSWYLTQIQTRNNEQINFTYNQYQYNQTEKTESHTIPSVSGGGVNCGDAQSYTYSPSLQKNYITSRVIVQQLKAITWKNGTISFIPGPNRTDLQQINSAAHSGTSTTAAIPCLGGLRMSQTISPYYTNVVKEISFDYAQSPRLFLKKLSFNNINGSMSCAYQFSYNNVDYTYPSAYTWPSYDPDQASYNARDYWGYYNGVLNNSGMIPYDAISDAPPILHNPVENGGLPNYPPVTGINITGYRGLNNRVPNPNFACYGTLKEIIYPTGGKTVFTYDGNIVKKQMVPTATPEAFTLVSTLKTTTDQQNNTLVTLGGVRINQMDFFSDIAFPAALTTHVIYDQSDINCGFIPFFYTYTERLRHNYTSGGEFSDDSRTCFECSNAYIYTFNSSGTVTDSAPVVQYGAVREYTGSTNSGGQIIHTYSPANKGNEPYYQSPYPVPNVFNWHSNETQVANQLPNGSNVQVKTKLIGSNAGVSVAGYDFKISLIRNDGCTATSPPPHFSTEVEPVSDAEADIVVSGIYTWTKVAISTENYVPTKVQEITYDANGQQVDGTLNYNYDMSLVNPLLPSSTSGTDSKDQTVKTLISYPQNYFSGTPATTSDPVVNGMVNLISHNLLANPIEQITTFNQNGTEYVTGARLALFYPDKVAFSKILSLTLTTPVPLSSFTKSYINSSGTLIYDSRYQPERQFHVYNSSNQLLEFSDNVNGVHHSILWDYNSSYQIAEVINASQADIAYTSFEADGTGNWTISAISRTASGFSGTHSYPLSSTNTLTKSDLTSSRSYIISYWTTSTSPLTIAGTQANYPIKGVTAGNWTYYEHLITGQAAVTLSSATATNIDEVRLYPNNASMTTWTYNPLIGISSSVNEKSQVLYYGYDDMLRLTNIIDKDGNIIKHTDYHYLGQ